MSKKCTQCNKSLLLSAFNKSKRSATGLRSSCRDCDKKCKDVYMAKIRALRPPRIKKQPRLKVNWEERKKQAFLEARLEYTRKMGEWLNRVVNMPESLDELLEPPKGIAFEIYIQEGDVQATNDYIDSLHLVD